MSKTRTRDSITIEDEINSILDQLQIHKNSFDEDNCEKILL